MKNNEFNLKKLLGHFSDIGEMVYGKILDLDLLEKRMQDVRDGKEDFSLKHLRAINEDYAFIKWWKMPEISEQEVIQLRELFKFIDLKNQALVEKVYAILKHIEIVSCVLRFIKPQYYAIFSPPVENLINIRGINPVEKYLNYIGCLEKIGIHYEIVEIARVDMALWALANIINFDFLRKIAVYREIYDDYIESPNFIKKINAQNSLRQIWQESPLYIDLAALFYDTDFVLAGIIASKELEYSIKELCKDSGIKFKESTIHGSHWFSIPELVEKLRLSKEITRDEENIVIERWWDLRNALMHKPKANVIKEEVSQMIDWIIKFKQKYEI